MPTTQDIEAGNAPAGIGSPTVSFAPPPPTPYRPPPDRALQPWQVEDRNTYIAAKQQIQQQQMAAAQAQLDRIAELQRRYVNPVRQAYSQIPNLLEQENARAQIAALPDAQRRQAEAQAEIQPIQVQGVDRPIFRGPPPLEHPQGGIGNVTGPLLNAATTAIPGAQNVADIAGQIGQKAGQTAVTAAMGPLAPLEQFSPIKPSEIAGKVTGFGAESLIPTEVWQAALELAGGGFTEGIPGLVRAVKAGSPDAISAVTKAGQRLGASEEVQSALGKLASELGQSKIPGQAAEEAAPNAARVAQLQEQRANLTKAISVLNAGERAKLTIKPTVKDVFSIGERYAAGTPQRDALMQVVDPLIANEDPTVQRVIKAWLETAPSKAERAAATTAQRARQANLGTAAFEQTPGTGFEKAAASFKAFAGQQVQRFAPIGGQFTDTESAKLQDMIVQAAKDHKISFFEQNNALDALSLLMSGNRLKSNGALNLAPGELKLLGRVFGPQFEAAAPRTAVNLSGADKVLDVLNLPRALVTAVDFSAAGRQGILLAARNPVEFSKSFKPMIQAMASEQGFQKVAQNIWNNPKSDDALIHGLFLADIGGGKGAEEAFISHIADKLPWVRGSERGYVAFLDNLRMLAYEKYANRLEDYAGKKGWDIARTDAVKTQVASFLNHATGRGSLAQLNEFTPALNAVFFSPRYFVSRPQSIWDMVNPKADKFTRQVAFENLGAFVGTGVGMLTMLNMTGAADVELDPRSADFGRIKIGPTRIDFWGGYQPIARYIAQIATGHTKNTSTGVTTFANPGDSATRFFRSKLSPAGAAVYDYLPGKQKDYAGNDLIINPRDLGPNKETGALAWNTFLTKVLPLSIQDAIQGYQTQGIGGALGAGAVSALGGGVSSYEPTEKQQKVIAKNEVVGSLKDQGVPYAGNQIDFRQPQLNGKPNGKVTIREGIAMLLHIDNVPSDASLADIKKLYVEQKKDAYIASTHSSEAIAERDLRAAFDKVPVVDHINKTADTAEINYWKAHPDRLRKAIDAKETSISKEKLDILKKAGQ